MHPTSVLLLSLPQFMTAIGAVPVDHKVLRTIFVSDFGIGTLLDACALRSCPSDLMNSVTLRRNNCDLVRSISSQMESMVDNNSFGKRKAVDESRGVLRKNFNYTSSYSSNNQDRLLSLGRTIFMSNVPRGKLNR